MVGGWGLTGHQVRRSYTKCPQVLLPSTWAWARGLSEMEQSSGLPTGETLPRGNSLLISGFPACPCLPPSSPLSLLGAMESHVPPSLKHAWFCLRTNEGGQDRGDVAPRGAAWKTSWKRRHYSRRVSLEWLFLCPAAVTVPDTS